MTKDDQVKFRNKTGPSGEEGPASVTTFNKITHTTGVINSKRHVLK